MPKQHSSVRIAVEFEATFDGKKHLKHARRFADQIGSCEYSFGFEFAFEDLVESLGGRVTDGDRRVVGIDTTAELTGAL